MDTELKSPPPLEPLKPRVQKLCVLAGIWCFNFYVRKHFLVHATGSFESNQLQRALTICDSIVCILFFFFFFKIIPLNTRAHTACDAVVNNIFIFFAPKEPRIVSDRNKSTIWKYARFVVVPFSSSNIHCLTCKTPFPLTVWKWSVVKHVNHSYPDCTDGLLAKTNWNVYRNNVLETANWNFTPTYRYRPIFVLGYRMNIK